MSIAIDIVHQDASFVIVNKPAGLLSVPGRGPDKQDCVSARVQQAFSDALIVHRLDMETSGLMVFARGLAAQRALSRAFEQRVVDKCYEAIVSGLVADDAGHIDLPLITDWPNRPRQKVDVDLGKPSTTLYRVLERDLSQRTTRVELTPITGRSHQLRVHFMSLGHAIIGDSLYAPPDVAVAPRLMLHARVIAFPHPVHADRREFVCSTPF
ncbi:MAG: RluA family pseudouridine synthase [Burkholderiales bacterium]|nr:RluA family pseudouridine synthase [Burkholderiales bacterium]